MDCVFFLSPSVWLMNATHGDKACWWGIGCLYVLNRWKNGLVYALHRTLNSKDDQKVELEVRRSEDRFSDSYAMRDAYVCLYVNHTKLSTNTFFSRANEARASISVSLLLLLFSVNSVCFILVSEYIFTFFLFICGIWYKWTYGGIAPPPLPPLSSPPPNPYLYVCLSVRTTWLPFFAHSRPLSPSLSLTFRNASEPDSSF